jgi:hypothetical protein
MTAAIFFANSKQLKFLTSYLNANICQGSDSSGNMISHHLFFAKSESSVGQIVGRIMEYDSNNAGDIPWFIAARQGDIAGLDVMLTYHSNAILDSGDSTALHEASAHGQTLAVSLFNRSFTL